MKINYRKKFEEATEEANMQRARAEQWLAEAESRRAAKEGLYDVLQTMRSDHDKLARLNEVLHAQIADLESDAKHDLIVIQLQRDALVRLRKIADLAGKLADAIYLDEKYNLRRWCAKLFRRDALFYEGATFYARDIRTALAAEEIDSQIARRK